MPVSPKIISRPVITLHSFPGGKMDEVRPRRETSQIHLNLLRQMLHYSMLHYEKHKRN